MTLSRPHGSGRVSGWSAALTSNHVDLSKLNSDDVPETFAGRLTNFRIHPAGNGW